MAPLKRKLKSDSSACHKLQQQLLFPQEIHIPRTRGQKAAVKYEQRDYKNGRKSRHTLLQAPTTALSSGLWNFFIIHLCICPVALKCQERLLTERGRNHLTCAIQHTAIISTELPKLVPPHKEKLQISGFFPALYQ